MKDLYRESRLLFELAFPEAEGALADRLFARYFPRHIRISAEGGKIRSLLFSIPYPIKTADGPLEARYLYGIATHPSHRGQGHASALIREEIEGGCPVFLRPATPQLFPFYERLGMEPFSPLDVRIGDAEPSPLAAREMTVEEYLHRRGRWLPLPHCAPMADFLRVRCPSGGAVEVPGECAALYERRGSAIRFSEWLGDENFAPRLAAFLGGGQYELFVRWPSGTPFGVGVGIPLGTHFDLALHGEPWRI